MSIKGTEGWTQYGELAFATFTSDLVTSSAVIQDKIYIKMKYLFLQVLLLVNIMLDC